MIMVNGNTWPFQTVEQRRYRLRFLNGCQSRFLVLDFGQIPGVEVWQIGNEGGFLAAPVNLTADHDNRLLMGLAERADLIVDFTKVPVGNHVLGNVGPDEPFGGGEPDEDFDAADPSTTGQVLQFRVVPAVAPDPTTPPQFLVLPPITALPAATRTRPLALIEMMSAVLGRAGRGAAGPPEPGRYAGPPDVGDAVTENPSVGDTEVWEFHNFTADAHPMHVHEIELRGGEPAGAGAQPGRGDRATVPARWASHAHRKTWESGFKDTVIAYPGEVTRIRAQVQPPGPVRLALPHRRARGQRDDAPLPHRTGATRPAGVN